MSLGKWKEREKEQRRNDIINAAKKFFADRDFDEVSMDEIAENMGLGKSTLYLYFKNKEALYFLGMFYQEDLLHIKYYLYGFRILIFQFFLQVPI